MDTISWPCGGQGVKTASQILDTAAHLARYQAQDFPYAPHQAALDMAHQPIDAAMGRNSNV